MNPTSSEHGVFDWDDELVNQYYELIHPTFPLLPESKSNLQSRLAEAPASMRDAFLEALYSTVRSSPASRARGVSTSNARRASDLIISAQFESPTTRSHRDNLIYLQTLILMGLEADNHGPDSSPPRAAWLGAAVGLVYNMKLHSNRLPREKLQTGDPDSDEKLGRRAWWVLVVLDRWHAISTSSPLFIPDSSVALLVEDQNVLGVALYHITRLSCIMGHLAESLTAADGEISTAYTSRLLRGELERFRETVEPLWAQKGSLGLVELAYYHVKLLSLRHASRTDPIQLLGPAIRITDILSSAQNPTTPLSHHFAALALGALLDLADFEETKKDACAGIEKLIDALEKRWTTPERDEDGWDKAIKELIERRRQPRYGAGGGGGSDVPRGHGSLQHLAELAVGERSPTAPTSGTNYPTLPHLDMARLQRHGYLGSLVL
ncbi:hypothetical protein EV426DRAFT_534927 [Tirmania nivea]|nr:hypothetical protein EV426DRAFT_534927 [Tirmania nivea]